MGIDLATQILLTEIRVWCDFWPYTRRCNILDLHIYINTKDILVYFFLKRLQRFFHNSESRGTSKKKKKKEGNWNCAYTVLRESIKRYFFLSKLQVVNSNFILRTINVISNFISFEFKLNLLYLLFLYSLRLAYYDIKPYSSINVQLRILFKWGWPVLSHSKYSKYLAFSYDQVRKIDIPKWKKWPSL